MKHAPPGLKKSDASKLCRQLSKLRAANCCPRPADGINEIIAGETWTIKKESMAAVNLVILCAILSNYNYLTRIFFPVRTEFLLDLDFFLSLAWQ